VVAKGFVSKLEYERRRQSALAARQELSRLDQQLASTRSDIARTVNERSSARLDGQNQQASAKSAIEGLRQQRSRVEGEASYLVEAPVSGRITAVQTGVGQTVGNSVPMMVVMPEGARLRADIYVPSRAIGFIRPGQEVRLLYDAFPYQRFGSFRARVDTISRVAIAGTETNAPFKIDEPVYRITAVPDNQQILAYGKPVPLQPGMTLVANIVLERQTFLDWFLSPLHAVANRS
ncbi:MAG: HlyD family efflux transporter periplasmic adaptor subunit, partial [Oxalobacteraceae bacterium]